MGNGAKIGIIAGAFLFLIIGLPVLFAGCGGKNEAPATTQAPEKERITLEIWNLYDEEKAFKGPIDRFRSLYNAEKNITINYTTFTNEEKYEELLIDAMASGNGPDIFAMHHSWLPRHKDKISPTPEYLMIPETYKETFTKVVHDRMILENEDGLLSIYGMPMYVDTLALFYNKNMFDIIKPDGKIKPEETWDGIKAQSRAISTPDQSLERFKQNGIAMGRTDNIRYGIDILQLIMAQEELDLYDKEMKEVQLSKTQETSAGEKVSMKNAMLLYTGFDTGWETLHESWNEFLTAKYPDDKELGTFVRQKTGMIFGYSDTYEELVDLIKKYEGIKGESAIKESDIGITDVPQMTASEDRRSDEFPVTLGNFYPLTVSKHSANPDLAWEFLIAASGGEGYEDYNKIIPGRPTALQPSANPESTGNINTQKKDKQYGVFARQVQYATTFSQLDKEMFEAILGESVERAKKRGIDKVLTTANNQLQCVLDKINKKQEQLDQDCLEVE